MLYNLTQLLQNVLDQIGLYSLIQVVYQLEFRAVGAVLLSFFLVMVFARPVIRWLARQKVGDSPEFYNERVNELMKSRAGTPTMGGVLICGSILLTVFLLADILYNRYVHLAIVTLLWLAILGGIDDWLKLTSARRKPGSREGLYAWEKLLFQLGLGVMIGLFLYMHAGTVDAHVLNLPFQRTYVPTQSVETLIQPPLLSPGVIVLGMLGFVIIAAMLLAGTSNAVNLTDGMDGLATGTLLVASLAMMILTYISGNSSVAYYLLVPSVPGTGELMVVAGAMAGACLGFLWFNCSPASVFMGDTGSLPMGGLLAYIAIAIRQEVLLVIIGGVFFIEMFSVMIQVSYFKYTSGKRIFRMSPIHHHFHLGGWSEHQVVARFWLVAIVLAMIALVSLKLR
ncbi:MAG: phospho-N-acetylmuramoyl-pentapeptide-transferase [Phycisphaerae bacterium]|nr:phospho-N-acetylmuramoyl-pentapeptide-transferase [Phycisphaerae bacterium]